MSRYANPPKLRSYVDHRPHTPADNFIQWGRTFPSYFDHWPEPGDGPIHTSRTVINSYVDHFAKPGDLNQM